MVKYLIICRSNPIAPWPSDPEEYSKFMQSMLASFDDYIKQGIIKDIGFFLDGNLDEFVIVDGEGPDILKGNISFSPYWLTDTREIVSFETIKELFKDG